MEQNKSPVPLPSAPAVKLAVGLILQPPLSRRGHGPGLIIVQPGELAGLSNHRILDPPPLQKWAEEGYAVIQITYDDGERFEKRMADGVKALLALPECDKDTSFGIISL